MGAAVALQAREHPPKPATKRGRVEYIQDLMVRGAWVSGQHDLELGAEWELDPSTIRHDAAEASRHLELLGQREFIVRKIQAATDKWVDESGPDRVSAATLLLKSVGGLEERTVVRHELSGRSEQELLVMALTEIKSDPVLRAKAIAFLTAEGDSMALLTEGSEVG